jgi:ParB-like chromosome segregation protein Spo0J
VTNKQESIGLPLSGVACCDDVAAIPTLVTYSPDQLRPHPAYVASGVSVPAAKLAALMTLGDAALAAPILTTSGGVIIDGHARLEVARRQHRTTVLCLAYDIGDNEALQFLIAAHSQPSSFNTFARVGLALHLEPALRERARDHQRQAGRNRGSSTLTEPDRLDVRSEIGRIAAASAGTVTKVKQLLNKAIPEVLDALRLDEVSIDRAWQWCGLDVYKQREKLRALLSEKGVRRTIRILLARQKARVSPARASFSPARLTGSELSEILAGISSNGRTVDVAVVVAPVAAPGDFIVVSHQLYKSLNAQRELDLKCPPS